MRERSIFSFDFLILLSTAGLIILGIFFIYSSGVSFTGEVYSNEYIKQLIWAVLGIILLFLVSIINPTRLRQLSTGLFCGFIFLLIITLIFGRRTNGAKSWIGIMNFGIQPSEFTKIATILLLASYYENRRKVIDQLSTFLVGFAILLIPVLLILIQPDFGTALVFFPIFLFISFIAGVPVKYILFVFFSGIFGIVLSVLPAWESYFARKETFFVMLITEKNYLLIVISSLAAVLVLGVTGFLSTKKKYFYWISYFILIVLIAMGISVVFRILLMDYQIMRLIVFIDPYVDQQGTGWNIIQSITAVGSGGFWGKGFLKGTQCHYQFLPQQSTDFIFSVIGEELGYIGTIFILLCFSIIFIRSILIMMNEKELYPVLLGTGVISMIFFHVMVNIGMAVGIMPITGIPLFFLSYGGSSLWTAMIGIGLIMNVYIHRYKY